MVLVIGNGVFPVPNAVSEIAVPVSLAVYADCGVGCSSPVLLRNISVDASVFGDHYGNRPL